MAKEAPKAPKSATPSSKPAPTKAKAKVGAPARPKASTTPKAKASTPRVTSKPKTEAPAQVEPAARVGAYTEATGAAICAAIAEGMSLRSVLKLEGMPAMSTFMRWLADEANEQLREQYARAREAQADHMAEEILQIADDGRNDTYVDDEGQVKVDHDVIARSRLRVDARKWLASKMAPKKYGDKLVAEHVGAGGGAIQVASTVTFVHPPMRGDDE